MKLNFEELIDDRTNKLTNKIESLNSFKNTLKLIDPIDFNLETIEEKVIVQDKVTYFEFLKEKKGAFVYIFEIIDETLVEDIKDRFCKYKKTKKVSNMQKRATPFLPNNIKENTSKILYVGSIKNGLHKRIKEHLGYGSASTGALHLKYWMSKSCYLNIHLIPIENVDLTYDIEAAIASKLKPLIGKTPD